MTESKLLHLPRPSFMRPASALFCCLLLCCGSAQARALRGVNITAGDMNGRNVPGGQITQADLVDLARWNANLVRWQLVPDNTSSIADYRADLNDQLRRLSALLPVCRDLDIAVIVDLHWPAGGIYPEGHSRELQQRLFFEPVYEKEFYRTWETITKLLSGHDIIHGYDILNEPNIGPQRWRAVASEAARRIRRHHASPWIIVESPRGEIDTLPNFQPLPNTIDRVKYSVHVTTPRGYTHQGLAGFERARNRYPGKVSGRYWDYAELRRALTAVRTFERKHGVEIFIGEFSVARWAVGGDRYLSDLIRLFENRGWDWTYHAFRESTVWSIEHDARPRNTARPSANRTRRANVILNWFHMNVRRPRRHVLHVPGGSAGAGLAIASLWECAPPPRRQAS